MKPALKYVVIMLIALGASHLSSACTCYDPEKPLDTLTTYAFEASDLIVEGTVLSVKYATAGIPSKQGGVIRSTAEPIKAIIAVSRLYKGEIESDTIEVITAMDEITCGYPFKRGLNYLVYIYDSDKFTRRYAVTSSLNTGFCSRTEVLEDVDAAELNILSGLHEKWINTQE